MDFEAFISFAWLASYAFSVAVWACLGMPPMAHPYLQGLADGAFAILCLRCVGEYLATRCHRRRRFHQ